jgi:glycosyltransferase involved in cell wall biosynthesis
MKIAILGSKGLPARSGTERVVESLIPFLSKKNKIYLYCNSHYTSSGTKSDYTRITRINTISSKYFEAPIYYILSALHALFFEKFDLIHIHNVEASFIVPFLRIKYKVLSTAHGSPRLSGRSKWNKLAKMCMSLMELPFVYCSSLITSVSKKDARYFKEKYKKDCYYIPNGVDLSNEYDETFVREYLKRNNIQSFILFAAGRIDPTKGCHVLLNALKQLKYKKHVIVIGDLNQVPNYSKDLVDNSGENIKFVGFIESKDRLLAFFKMASVIIFPSFAEGMSMVLLEALMIGTPVICSDIQENKDVVGKTGIYFKTGDHMDLARKIQWSNKRFDFLKRNAITISKSIKKEYYWGQIGREYNLLYNRLKKG